MTSSAWSDDPKYDCPFVLTLEPGGWRGGTWVFQHSMIFCLGENKDFVSLTLKAHVENTNSGFLQHRTVI